MNINWTVRLKNRDFWIALIPALLLLVKQVAGIFGIDLDFSLLQSQILAVIGTIFMILVIIGVVNDPTTDGFKDSTQAMTYEEPKVSEVPDGK